MEVKFLSLTSLMDVALEHLSSEEQHQAAAGLHHAVQHPQRATTHLVDHVQEGDNTELFLATNDELQAGIWIVLSEDDELVGQILLYSGLGKHSTSQAHQRSKLASGSHQWHVPPHIFERCSRTQADWRC